jgi:hypothetical protein
MTIKQYENIGWTLVGIGTTFLLVTCAYFWNLTTIATPNTIDSNLTGAMGSFISGFVGVLFSLAAVLFFVVALKSQKEELNLQRQEFKLQREEFGLQREELSETRAVFSLQQFESSFFNLLASQQHIRQVIQSSGENNFIFMAKRLGNLLDTSAVKQFEAQFKEYLMDPEKYSIRTSDLEGFINLTSGLNMKELSENYQRTIYNKFFENENDRLGHYINNLYLIVKYLRDYDLSQKSLSNVDCQWYFNYIVAPMSRPELYILGQHTEANQTMSSVLEGFEWKSRFNDDTGLMF